MPRSKQKYEKNINSVETASTCKSIAISVEAKKNQMKFMFIRVFILNFYMNQQHLFCFYTSNIIKSNEGAINRIPAKFPPWLILHWKYILSNQTATLWGDTQYQAMSIQKICQFQYRGGTKLNVKELTYKVEKSAIFIDTYKQKQHLQSFVAALALIALSVSNRQQVQEKFYSNQMKE